MSFLFLFAFVWFTESARVPQPDGFWRASVLVGIVMLSVLLHEFGHILAAALIGEPRRTVMLMPIGGVPLITDASATGDYSAGRETRVAIAGPLTNLLLALGIFTFARALLPEVELMAGPHLHSSNLFRAALWANIYIAGINMLPAYPLDAGRVLRALFSLGTDQFRAARRATAIAQAFSMLLIFVGIFSPWVMMAGLFLFLAIQIEERSAVFHSVLETVRMEEVMLTDFATLSPADTLEDALAKAVHTLQDDFPVVRGTDMVGVVSRQKMVESLRGQGNAYVQSVMNRAYDTVGPQETLAAAFRKLTARGITLVPVVDGERLVGIVTLQNLMHSMGLLAETRRLRSVGS
jgi:CBS domain-containing protein